MIFWSKSRRIKGTAPKRKRIQTTLGYFEKNQVRMPYAAFIAADLDIGSGAVEGAIRNVVRMRLDGPGMRWGRKRAELILHLRCILVSNQWVDFTDYLAIGEAIRFNAQPVPAQPHTAKTKKAAA